MSSAVRFVGDTVIYDARANFLVRYLCWSLLRPYHVSNPRIVGIPNFQSSNFFCFHCIQPSSSKASSPTNRSNVKNMQAVFSGNHLTISVGNFCQRPARSSAPVTLVYSLFRLSQRMIKSSIGRQGADDIPLLDIFALHFF